MNMENYTKKTVEEYKEMLLDPEERAGLLAWWIAEAAELTARRNAALAAYQAACNAISADAADIERVRTAAADLKRLGQLDYFA